MAKLSHYYTRNAWLSRSDSWLVYCPRCQTGIMLCIYPSYFSCLGVGCVTRPFGATASGVQICQADLSFTLVTELSMLLGVMSLKEAHPLGQRKRCSNRSLTDLSLRCRVTRPNSGPSPFGASTSAVQKRVAFLSSNSNYFGYMHSSVFLL